MRIVKLLIVISVAFLAAGCGGGGGGTPPPRTATITFGVMANITTQVAGITLTAKLPPGVSVAFDPATMALTAPSLRSTTGALQGSVTGTYASSSNQVTLNWVLTSLGKNIGTLPFAQLDCTIQPGATLTQQDFIAANTPFPFFLRVGIDPVTNAQISTDDVLAGKLTPAITSVTFGL